MPHRISKTLLLIAWLLLPLGFIQAAEPSAQENLQQSVAELQKSPNDQALREKIIKLVLTMNPPPAIPEDAERFMVRGQVALETAKDAKGFQEVAAEFEKVVLAAPWLAEGYFNLAIVQEKAERYSAAIKNLKLYLLAAPGAADTKETKALLYNIEFMQEKAAQKEAHRHPIG